MIHVEIACPLCFSDEVVPVCHYCGGTAIVVDDMALSLMVKNGWVQLSPTCEEREYHGPRRDNVS